MCVCVGGGGGWGRHARTHTHTPPLAPPTPILPQLYFSLGLRLVYLFIPCVMWVFGGTYLLITTLLLTFALFELDSV